ncbi:VOC family protein [Sediminibacillus halophilus]|uniref:PhnB protein n=1 Tax=Sediminibacillus halophilus TaxID=482461 RepID=A0A1G9PFR0_9BACI|nr:VOC family protein [Sediminibacillus halophilus]SDL97598.1 PhnB protein [Sediminibacillus halophilus]
MQMIIPHITVENCKEALTFYQQIFGGEIKNTQLADEIEMFKGHEGKYIHAELHVDDRNVFYFVDVFGEAPAKGSQIELSLALESEDEIQHVYQALADEGQVTMELQDTFWNARYAKVIDKYGIHWELNVPKA